MPETVNPPEWLSSHLLPSTERALGAVLATSRRLLREHQHPSGAWPAAPTFAPYGYSWFRDGSFVAEGASAAGLQAEAERFHRWCAGVLERERPAVEAVRASLAEGVVPPDSELLPARYSLDGTRHEDDWWNFQVDGYGTWVQTLRRHLARTGGDVAPYAEAVRTATRYLVATGTGTCRDWWEENRDQVHVTTLAGVAAGLRDAVALGVLPDEDTREAESVAATCLSLIRTRGTHDGRLTSWLDGERLDASLLAVSAVYDVLPLDDPLVAGTVAAVEATLATGPGGGVHRYADDVFYGGGQWPVLACLLALHRHRSGDDARAAELVAWVVSTADEHGRLPEQVAPRLAPEALPEWEERWGPSAHPLLWSHGNLLALLGG